MIKKELLFGALIVILFSLNALSAKLIDKIVATVNGEPITLYELKNISPLYKAKTPKALLNMVIDDYLIEQYARNVGIRVSEEDVEKYLENMARRNNMSVDEFLNRLKESGIDIEEYKRGIKLQLYRYLFARRVFLPTISISQKDIENYKKLHKNMLKSYNRAVVLSIISLPDLKTAQMVYSKLKSGANFYEMLKKYSLNKNPRREIPIMALNPYLQKKILSLKKGEFTNILEAGGKFYIVKLIDIKQEGGAKERIRFILAEKQIEAKLKSWLKMVRARSDIEIYLK